MSFRTVIYCDLAGAFAGGYAGVKLKIPAGALIGALVAAVAIRLLDTKARKYLISSVFWAKFLSGDYRRGVTLDFLNTCPNAGFPLSFPWSVSYSSGLALAFLIYKMGYLDFPTAYLGTSPGAMSAIVIVGVEYGANGAIVASSIFSGSSWY